MPNCTFQGRANACSMLIEGNRMFQAYPLDMSQYSSLFNNTRIPEIGKDRLYHDKTQRHIVVLRHGHFYTFNALDEFGTRFLYSHQKLTLFPNKDCL